MAALEYSPADELLNEFEEYVEWSWELDEKVDDGEYARIELYIEDIETDEFHALGADMDATTAVTNDGERYTLSKKV